MSVTQTEELHLVNIISIGEDKLQSNFTMILNRLREHDRLIAENNLNINQLRKDCEDNFSKAQKESTEKFSDIEQMIKEINNEMSQQKQSIFHNLEQIEQRKRQIEESNERWQTHKYQIDEEIQVKNNQVGDLNQKSEELKMTTEELKNSLLTKQSITEVEKIIKEMGDLKQKNHLLDNDIKLIQHKVEKMEILSQKAERAQAKKDAEFLKEVEEKIKKEAKGLQKSSTPQRTNSRESAFSGDRIKLDNTISFRLEEQEIEKQLRTSSMNVQKNMAHLNQKVGSLEGQFKEMIEVVKNMKQFEKKNKHSSGEGLIEKLNELKSQMIKLWAKCDALDDRIVFTDRKMEEKGKIIHNLVESQKQNSWAKMEDKLKTFQTEMYAFIKQIKTKVQGKIGTQQYEKHNQTLQTKIKQINQQIFLKSDKLQVKKALLFLESKIKQIILVISEDEQNEKDALLTKKQLKCISCDKDVQKMSGCSNTRGNWDTLPYRDHAPEVLGRFGMTNYGSLAKKLKKLQNQDLPILSKKNKENQNGSKSP